MYLCNRNNGIRINGDDEQQQGGQCSNVHVILLEDLRHSLHVHLENLI